MNDNQWKIFKEIAEQCELGIFSTINVASKKRSDAIVAVYKNLVENVVDDSRDVAGKEQHEI